MYEVYLETKKFILDFAKKEVSKLTSRKIEEKGNFIVVKFQDEIEFFDFAIEIMYYSRCIERMFLRVENPDFIKNDFTFEIDSRTGNRDVEKVLGEKFLEQNHNLSVDLKNPDISFKVFDIAKEQVVLLDLTNFTLSKRDYKLHSNSTSLNTLLAIYAFYKLGIDDLEELRLVDPSSNLGDIIIEASIFNPRKPLNINKRYEIPLSKIFPHIPKLPREEKRPNKIVSIVQNNKIFKQQKENINYIKSKIKLSQFETDWLDVKFKDSDFDFLITQILPDTDKKVLEEFFYQAEFITKDAICTISKKEIPKRFPEKFKLKQKSCDCIEIGEQPYYIQIFK